MASKDIGHLNPNGKEVIRRVGPSPTLRGQYTYELRCTHCQTRYGANGPDIDGAGAGTGRKCPNPTCQGGSPGDPID
jgi:hypothetical protein